MTQFILGLLFGGGVALTWICIVEKEEQKKRAEMEKWEVRLP